MAKNIRAAAAAIALGAAIAAPTIASAAVSGSLPPVRYQMQTSFRDDRHPGEIAGNLALLVYPSGIVSGYYIPQDGQPRNVTGGVDGQNIWLDIGGIDSLHLSGTLKNGTLNTIASIPGPDTWVFESTHSVRQSG